MAVIKGVLDAAQLKQVNDLMDAGEFHDGGSYVGAVAKNIKKNEELKIEDQRSQQLGQIVVTALYASPGFMSAAFPLKVAQPMFANYREGMQFGFHVDEPVMGPPTAPYRSDVSCTVFLNDPEDYDGGELEIQTPFGNNIIKLDAGDAVVYPSTSIHKVREVTDGVRKVAVTWIQSMVPDPLQRELLYEFGQTVERLVTRSPEDEDTLKLTQYYANLRRMWTDT